MASVSVSHMIIFIASMIIAAGVAGTFTTEVGKISGAIDERALDVSEKLKTDIEIISDPGSEVWNSSTGNVTVYVKNTGSMTLTAEADQVDVFVDGVYQTNLNVSVLDGSDWQDGNVVEITFDYGSLPSGDHRIKVVVNGDEDTLVFRKNP